MRLLPILAAALAAGLAARPPLPVVLILAPAFLVRRLAFLRAPALAFAAGALLPAERVEPGLPEIFPDGVPMVRVEGVVHRGPDPPANGYTWLTLDVDRVGDDAVRGRVRVVGPEDAPRPPPGARVAATGRLVRPRPAENPGAGGPREALAAQGVSHVLVLRTGPALEVLAPSPFPALPAALHAARTRLDLAIAALHPPDTAGLLSALLVGRRDRLDDEIEDDFRRSGTSHILAISGLHVALLAGMAWLVLRGLPLPRPLVAALLALIALTYAAVTGLEPPAFRAALFTTLAAAGIVLRRPARIANLVSLAAVVILVGQPEALARPSFQLSFGAVLSILVLAPRFEEGLFARWKFLDRFTVPRERPLPIRIAKRYLMSSLPVSLAAFLGTTPIVLHWFGTFSPVTIPANLVVLPFLTVLLPAGLFAAATGWSPPAALPAAAFLGLTRFFADLPGACFALPRPPLAAQAAFYLLLFAAARRPAIGRTWTAGLLLALGGLAVSGLLLREPPERLQATVLSVGHGLCVVVETADDGVLVYDVGSRRPEVFQRVLLPYLRERRIAGIDLLVVSHGDADHVNGVDALLRWMPVGRVVRPGEARRGETLSLPGADVRVLWPPPGFPAGGNDGSTVLRIEADGNRILLTGDIEEVGLEGLLAAGEDLAADALVLPHHGRRTPFAAALLAAVGPKAMVASAAEGDPIDPAYAGALVTGRTGAITLPTAAPPRPFHPRPRKSPLR